MGFEYSSVYAASKAEHLREDVESHRSLSESLTYDEERAEGIIPVRFEIVENLRGPLRSRTLP